MALAHQRGQVAVPFSNSVPRPVESVYAAGTGRGGVPGVYQSL